jgi:hypothetical protein
MTRQIQQLKKEYGGLKNKAMLYIADMAKYDVEARGFNGFVSECAAEITRRVEELRKSGIDGETLLDFAQDKEIRSILDTVENVKKSYARNHMKLSERCVDGEGILDDLQAFRGRLDDEIESRKKPGKAKVVLGMATPQELDALADEAGKFVDGQFRIEVKSPQKLSFTVWERKLEQAVKDAQGGGRAKQDESDLAKRARDTRVIRQNLGTARDARDTVLARCIDAVKAMKSRDEEGTQTALDAARGALSTLEGIVKQYERSWKQLSEVNVENMKGTKDGRFVLSSFEEFPKLHAEADKAYKAVARKSVSYKSVS